MLFPSLNNVLALALLAAPLVAAHGKIAVATGDQGGNGTALGSEYIPPILLSTSHTNDIAVQGGVIPGAGPNKKTEVDTTVFKGKNADGCGETEGVSSPPDPNMSTRDLLTL
jgi:hypothetical protein